jgi:hypothetical protein
MEVEVSGTLAEKAEIKEFLLVRSRGRVEGHVNYGDMQVERGAVLAGGIFSVYSSAQVRPANDTSRSSRAKWMFSPSELDRRALERCAPAR